MKILEKLIAFLGSFGFVCILLLYTLALTYFGTLAQVEESLFDVQRRYFDSMLIWWGRIPLPGAYLTMMMLAVSLVIGGLIRLRKSWRLAGVFIVHVGIGMLLLAGWVKQHYSSDGQMTLYPADTDDEFKSYYHWEIAIARSSTGPGPYVEYLIDEEDFIHLNAGAARTFTRTEIPFDVTVKRYLKNCEPMPEAAPRRDEDGHLVNGYYLRSLPPRVEAEANVAGVYVTIKQNDTGHVQDAILWGFEYPPSLLMPGQKGDLPPLHVRAAGEDWGVTLRKRRETIPFEIQLDKFTHEMHPGTSMAKVFLSDVTMTEDGVSRPLQITMNEPLRHEGYTLFQTGYGPKDAPPGRPLFSTFAVVRNPSDQWPLYSCIVIAIGLSLHFVLKLWGYVVLQQRRLAR